MSALIPRRCRIGGQLLDPRGGGGAAPGPRSSQSEGPAAILVILRVCGGSASVTAPQLQCRACRLRYRSTGTPNEPSDGGSCPVPVPFPSPGAGGAAGAARPVAMEASGGRALLPPAAGCGGGGSSAERRCRSAGPGRHCHRRPSRLRLPPPPCPRRLRPCPFPPAAPAVADRWVRRAAAPLSPHSSAQTLRHLPAQRDPRSRRQLVPCGAVGGPGPARGAAGKGRARAGVWGKRGQRAVPARGRRFSRPAAGSGLCSAPPSCSGLFPRQMDGTFVLKIRNNWKSALLPLLYAAIIIIITIFLKNVIYLFIFNAGSPCLWGCCQVCRERTRGCLLRRLCSLTLFVYYCIAWGQTNCRTSLVSRLSLDLLTHAQKGVKMKRPGSLKLGYKCMRKGSAVCGGVDLAFGSRVTWKGLRWVKIMYMKSHLQYFSLFLG